MLVFERQCGRRDVVSHRDGGDVAGGRPEEVLLRWMYRTSRVAFDRHGSGDVSCLPPAAAAVVRRPNGAVFLPWLAGLERLYPGVLPTDLVERGRGAAFNVGVKNVRLFESFRPMAESFEARGVRWAALKGLDSCCRLFPGSEWRPMVDVDVLIHPSDANTAAEVLNDLGFSIEGDSFVTSRLAMAVAAVRNRHFVDLHRYLIRTGGDAIPGGVFLDGATLSDIHGIPVRLLRLDLAFAANALLLAKDLFLAQTTNPSRLVELALLAEMVGDCAIDAARRQMWAWHTGRLFERTMAVVDWVRARSGRPLWLDDRFGDPAVYAGPVVGRWRYMFGCAALQDSPLRAGRFLAVNCANWIRKRIA